MSQSNTRVGDFPMAAGEDLSGMEGRLVKVSHDGGAAEVVLPTDNGDFAFFVLVEGVAVGRQAGVRPIEAGRNVRLRLVGTCNPGDVLVLADGTTPANKGKVRALPAEAGTYRGLAIAEEAGIDGQLVLARPAMIGAVEVQ